MTFKRKDLHPRAADSFDLAGIELVKLIETRSPPVDNRLRFDSQRRTALTINRDQIIDQVECSIVDFAGRRIGRYKPYGNDMRGLFDKGYCALRSLSERVLEKAPFRGAMSRETIESAIWRWCRSDELQATKALSGYLIDRRDELVRPLKALVPIAHLEIETPFDFGPIHFTPFTQKRIDDMEAAYAAKHARSAEEAAKTFQSMRETQQGFAAIEFEVEAENDLAWEIALGVAENATSLLRFFSAATLSTFVYCPIGPLGSAPLQSGTVHLFSGTELPITISALRHSGLPVWQMSRTELEMHRKAGLDEVGRLLIETNLTDFQRKLRTALLGYTRSLGELDVNRRLVGTLSALESLFLKDSAEPVQGNLGDRLALFTETGLSERRATVGVVRCAYSVRSRYVHHLSTSQDDQALETFAGIALRALWRATRNLDRFDTHASFIEALDNLKFGG